MNKKQTENSGIYCAQMCSSGRSAADGYERLSFLE